MSARNPPVSVFLPFYDEEKVIQEVAENCLEFLEGLGRDYELLLVDDGSNDSTPEKADRLTEQHENVRAVHHDENRGYGRALATGFREADKPLVFYMDGDGQFDIEQLERFLEEIEERDMVIGFREDRQDSPGRKIVSRGFNMLAKASLPIDARDVDCGFKLVRGEVLDDVSLETERTVDAELLAKASSKGYDISELPVEHQEREKGESEASGVLGVRPGLMVKSLEEILEIRRSL